jgi:hypothetical protein
MATALKFVRDPGTGIDPEVKSWIDNVLVPALVREFLEDRPKEDSVPKLKIVAKSKTDKAFSQGDSK